MKKPFSLLLLVILLVSSLFLVFTLISFRFPKVLASSTATYYFKFAPNITTFALNFQNVTNTYGITVDVKTYIETVINQSRFQLFLLSANSTDFIMIQDGTIIQSLNTYYSLNPNEKLFYNSTATPIPTIMNGNTAEITYVTEIVESPVQPPITYPPIFPSIPNFALIVKIIDLFGMNAPELTVQIIRVVDGCTVATLTTNTTGETKPILLPKGEYAIKIYKDNLLQLESSLILKEDTMMGLQIGIPIVITFKILLIIILAIIICICLIILVLHKRKKK